MKKQYIYFATNDEDMAELMAEKLNDFFAYYNVSIQSKAYNKIYDFWDELDSLDIQQQSNSIVIFDPRIYHKIPELVESGTDNYWHLLRRRELYPWYELVLRYPLVSPIFLTQGNKLFGDIKKVDKFCYINMSGDINKQIEENITLFLNGFRTWFDPFELREKWRDRVIRAMFADEVSENKQIPMNAEKSKIVYCIEDEMEYALFSGYTAYKYGAKVHIVGSYGTLEWARESIFKQNSKDIGIIRDLDLRFRDHPQGAEDRDSLRKMKKLFPKNSNLDNLVISSDINGITSQYKLEKPLGNLYKIVDECNILEREQKRVSMIRNREKNKSKDRKNNHSAPYLNMQLAKDILAISSKSTNSYNSKVFKALLHLEAYLLLNNMAVTTSMQILKDLHLAELDFELSFIGIDKNENIKDRKDDVKEDIDNLLINVTNQNMKDSFLVSFWNDAKTIYKKHEQFNASEEANNEAMKLIEW